jgi:hypothetical protein
MKVPYYFTGLLIALMMLNLGCSLSNTVSRDKKKIVEMRSVAILPVEVIHLGRLHEVEDRSESQQLGIEREGFILQRDLYRYFLRDMNRYELDRSFLLDLHKTNELLKELEELSAAKIELSVREIAEWLGVDGIITTSVDQLAPSHVLMAGLMNGTLGNESNVSITLSLRSRYGQIYWRHKDEKPSNSEAVYDVSKGLLKQASKTFFSVYPNKKTKRKKKKEGPSDQLDADEEREDG